MAGQGIGAFIGRSQHKGIETVPDRQYVAFVNACAAATGFYVIDIIVGKRHHFIQIAVFQLYPCQVRKWKDSNLRAGYPANSLAGSCIQPLCHICPNGVSGHQDLTPKYTHAPGWI